MSKFRNISHALQEAAEALLAPSDQAYVEQQCLARRIPIKPIINKIREKIKQAPTVAFISGAAAYNDDAQLTDDPYFNAAKVEWKKLAQAFRAVEAGEEIDLDTLKEFGLEPYKYYDQETKVRQIPPVTKLTFAEVEAIMARLNPMNNGQLREHAKSLMDEASSDQSGIDIDENTRKLATEIEHSLIRCILTARAQRVPFNPHTYLETDMTSLCTNNAALPKSQLG